MRACHASASRHRSFTRPLKMLEHLFWRVPKKLDTKWWARRCLKCQARQISRQTTRQTVRWPVLLIPLTNSLSVCVSIVCFGLLPITAGGNSSILPFTYRFSRRANMFTISQPRTLSSLTRYVHPPSTRTTDSNSAPSLLQLLIKF